MTNQKAGFTPSEIREILMMKFTYSELQLLAFDMNIDLDNLPGGTVADKAREIVVYSERRKRLPELISYIEKERPDVFHKETSPDDKHPSRNDNDIDSLSLELASLRQQLLELQKGSTNNDKVEQKIDELLKTANRAVGRSEELTARVVLPRQEHMDVQLVPSHSLERLDEYRSDENIAYLMIGVFAGSILGILSNWVTSENFTITRFSIILMGIVLALTVLCAVWAVVIRNRANEVKKRIFDPLLSVNKKK